MPQQRSARLQTAMGGVHEWTLLGALALDFGSNATANRTNPYVIARVLWSPCCVLGYAFVATLIPGPARAEGR